MLLIKTPNQRISDAMPEVLRVTEHINIDIDIDIDMIIDGGTLETQDADPGTCHGCLRPPDGARAPPR